MIPMGWPSRVAALMRVRPRWQWAPRRLRRVRRSGGAHAPSRTSGRRHRARPSHDNRHIRVIAGISASTCRIPSKPGQVKSAARALRSGA